MKFYLYLFTFFIISCNQINNENFEIENHKLINEYKFIKVKFIKENAYKKTELEMLYSLDSIDYLYTVIKNKELAEKYIVTEKGLKRINHLKKFYEKQELKLILNKVPEKLHKSKVYIEIFDYVNK